MKFSKTKGTEGLKLTEFGEMKWDLSDSYWYVLGQRTLL